MREKRPFTRKSGLRDARLIVIASEGNTENSYFNGVKELYIDSRLHIEVLQRDDPSLSAPKHIIKELDDFKKSMN